MMKCSAGRCSSSQATQDTNVSLKLSKSCSCFAFIVAYWLVPAMICNADEMRESMLKVLGKEKYDHFFDKVRDHGPSGLTFWVVCVEADRGYTGSSWNTFSRRRTLRRLRIWD
jgi:hypothetical protein